MEGFSRRNRPDSRVGTATLGCRVGIIALLTASPGNVPLAAQQSAGELAGCYNITVGDWIVPEPAPGQPARPLPHETGDSAIFEMPPRIEFAGTFRDYNGRLTSRTRIVVPEGALPSVHGYMSGDLVGDTLLLSFNSVFFGIGGKLPPSENGWAGTVFTHTDTGDFNRRPVELTQVRCDSPPPVSIDAMRPVERSVELEDGTVITLGKPLPDSLEMAPGQLRSFRVVGHTTGLFGTTDSVSVGVGRDLQVVRVMLWYPVEAYGDLAARLRERLGSTREAVARTHASLRWNNRITDLRLTRSESSGNAGRISIHLYDPRLLFGIGLDPRRPLARSVELEGGSVITLRQPLPEAGGTFAREPGTRAVAGRTTGLFRGADSIVVRVNEAGVVRVIELSYRDLSYHASLQTRMAEAYGHQFRVLADTIRAGDLYRNPITEIRLTRRSDGGAYIRLSDHRYP